MKTPKINTYEIYRVNWDDLTMRIRDWINRWSCTNMSATVCLIYTSNESENMRIHALSPTDNMSEAKLSLNLRRMRAIASSCLEIYSQWMWASALAHTNPRKIMSDTIPERNSFSPLFLHFYTFITPIWLKGPKKYLRNTHEVIWYRCGDCDKRNGVFNGRSRGWKDWHVVTICRCNRIILCWLALYH